MSETFEDFVARYRDLAVVTCEWRAFELDDPEAMADMVLDRMRYHKAGPSLRLLYKCVEGVVDETYRKAAGKRSITETILSGSWTMFKRDPQTPTLLILKALQSLSARDADLLRQAYWDELSLIEMAFVNGRDAATQEARLIAALGRFAARLPKSEATDAKAAMRRIHPGTHRRFREERPVSSDPRNSPGTKASNY